MSFPLRLLAGTALLLATGGCATLGTNISGEFACRAGKSSPAECPPTSTVDARVTAELADNAPELEAARLRAGIGSGDLARTPERMLRIVFPAHVDEHGTLHDEAVAWAVVEQPKWAAELRRKPEERGPPLMRELRRQLKAAQRENRAGVGAPPNASTLPEALSPAVAAEADALADPATPLPSAEPTALADIPPFSLVSPPVLPSTAREAIAGTSAPAVEGFDMLPPPHARTPRPAGELTFPSAEAIEAAKAKPAAPAQAAAASEERK